MWVAFVTVTYLHVLTSFIVFQQKWFLFSCASISTVCDGALQMADTLIRRSFMDNVENDENGLYRKASFIAW